ncbi:MAG: TolC family protein, partial [Candidatus Omnitrophica bacterium]|nr:TolC family protein [Candidatus Omnitrophota bacterium]
IAGCASTSEPEAYQNLKSKGVARTHAEAGNATYSVERLPVLGATSNSLTLEWVLREVVSNNPSIKAAKANWKAMEQRVPQARAWEDARAEFNTAAGRFVSMPPNSMPDQMFSVEQMFPLSGRNRLRGHAITAEAAAAFEQLRRRQLEITSRARSSYYRLANAYEQLDLNRENTELLKQIVGVGRAR